MSTRKKVKRDKCIDVERVRNGIEKGRKRDIKKKKKREGKKIINKQRKEYLDNVRIIEGKR